MRFGLLGLLQAQDGEGNALPVAGTRQRLLLGALLVRVNRVVPAQELADIVWDGAPPAAAAALRTQVMRLRRALGQDAAARIIARDPGYVITLSAEELDVTLFEALHQQAGAAMRAGRWGEAARVLDPALGLWRGAALLDVESRVLRDECGERLEQLRVQAIEWQVEAGMHMGRHEQLVPRLRDLARQYPLREHNHAQLMLALYRCGRQGEALAAYQHARDVLVTELGVEPGSGLRDLHQRMLAADPALAVARPARPVAAEPQRVTPQELPSAVPGFTGRAAELEALTGLLDRSGQQAGGVVVISAIGGTAGVGKTALAVHWAYKVVDRFPDGQLYVNLRGHDPGQPVPASDALAGFLRSLGVPGQDIPPGEDERAARYRSLLAGQRMLIVLDNAGSAGQVRPLLPGIGACAVVVTSRDALAGLVVRNGAARLDLDVLPLEDAIALLRTLIGARAAASPDAVAELASQCCRLPLALRVAAELTAARPAVPLAAMVSELADLRTRLDLLESGEDPCTQVRAVFSWSYRHLDTDAARTFRLLGLHPGPDLEPCAAAALTGASVPQARRALDVLARAHLIQPAGPGRYGMHDLLRAYAAELAHAVDDERARERAIGQMLDHYLHTADAAALLLKPTRDSVILTPPRTCVTPKVLADHQEAQDWFEAEHRVLLAALALAAESGFEACAWQLPLAMCDFLERRGYWHESAAIQRTALATATRLGDIAGQAMASRALGRACAVLADYDQACVHMTDSLGLYRKLGDLDGQARVYQSLAWAAGRSGRHHDALRNAEQALDLFQAAGNRSGQAAALNALGYGHAMLGDPQRARPFCREALALNQELGLHRGEEAHAWDSLGYVENQLGHHRDAAECYQSALSLFRELGDRFNEAEILTHLGDALHMTGDQQDARAAWKEALVILDDLHHPAADQIRAKLGR